MPLASAQQLFFWIVLPLFRDLGWANENGRLMPSQRETNLLSRAPWGLKRLVRDLERLQHSLEGEEGGDVDLLSLVKGGEERRPISAGVARSADDLTRFLALGVLLGLPGYQRQHCWNCRVVGLGGRQKSGILSKRSSYLLCSRPAFGVDFSEGQRTLLGRAWPF